HSAALSLGADPCDSAEGPPRSKATGVSPVHVPLHRQVELLCFEWPCPTFVTRAEARRGRRDPHIGLRGSGKGRRGYAEGTQGERIPNPSPAAWLPSRGRHRVRQNPHGATRYW